MPSMRIAKQTVVSIIIPYERVWCEKYGVLTDTYRSEAKDAKNEQNANFPKEVSMQKHVARVPSDHFPVMIVVEVK